MRVAMVSDRASSHVTELSQALARNGYDVTVYMRRDGRRRPEPCGDGPRVVAVPAGPARPVTDAELVPHLGEFTDAVRDLCAADRPDVLHAHHWPAGLAAASAGRFVGVPVVQTFHTLSEIERRGRGADHVELPGRTDAEKLLGAEADRIAAACTDELTELVRMGVPRGRISVVPGGVDLDRFVPEGERAPRGKYPHRLVTAGDLVPRMGFATTIAALRALPDTELVIAGGPDKRRLSTDEHARFLRSFAGAMGVADRVRLAGHVPDGGLAALLRSADAVVCTPWYEPYGTVALAAMACGLPVVATAVGGLADVVVDGITGRLVPPRKPRELAGALRQLVGRQTQREQFGAAGRDRAAMRYSWKRVAGETGRVYEAAGALASSDECRSTGLVR
jgi:D-inositol-3-phosphate glycosyltransferase